MDFILALADIKDKDVTGDELLNAIESEEEELQTKKKSEKGSKSKASSKKKKS